MRIKSEIRSSKSERVTSGHPLRSAGVPPALALVLFGNSVCDLTMDHQQIATIPQSQRDCVFQPRVARNELPWVHRQSLLNPEGVASRVADPCSNPFRVEGILRTTPRVARSSQPWAEGWNPVGILQLFSRKALGLAQLRLATHRTSRDVIGSLNAQSRRGRRRSVSGFGLLSVFGFRFSVLSLSHHERV